MLQGSAGSRFSIFHLHNSSQFRPIVGQFEVFQGLQISKIGYNTSHRFLIPFKTFTESQSFRAERRFNRFSSFHFYNSSEFGPSMGQFEVFMSLQVYKSVPIHHTGLENHLKALFILRICPNRHKIQRYLSEQVPNRRIKH